MNKSIKKVGLIGWRGMVGEVLLSRMQAESDFDAIEAYFFTSSQVNQQSPAFAHNKNLLDAYDLETLSRMDIILTCQGGDYTEAVHTKLREKNWGGYWIDAASTLRLEESSTLVLDPVNQLVIDEALVAGKKDFIGCNCTVSLMLLAIQGLIKADLVEWVSAMTYQAASGAGKEALCELIKQNQEFSAATPEVLNLDDVNELNLYLNKLTQSTIGAPLSSNLLPWIDSAMPNGQTREEWKGSFETKKILNNHEIKVDGLCVRVPVLRCHSQALTLKLKRKVSIKEAEQLILSGNSWVKLIENTKEATIKQLTPAAVSNSLAIHVGRLRHLNFGENYLSLFTVGDQLLWGAAEPLRRMLRLLVDA